MRALALLAVVAACHGHAATPPDAPPDAAPDAPGLAITGTELVRQISNDANHMPVITELPRHAISVVQLLPDGMRAPVAVGAGGTFAFRSPTAALRLEVTRDGGAPLEYQLAATHLDFAEGVAGRYDRTAPTAGTALSVMTTGANAGGAVVDTTGLWTQTSPPKNANGAMFTLDWTKATALSGPIGLVDATANDRAWIAYFNSVTGGYVALDEACSADLTMTAGATTNASCASVALPLDRCVQAMIDDADEYQRLVTALPAALGYTGGSWLWYVAAVPEPQLGPIGALWLAFGGSQNAPTTNLAQPIAYADPFPGHTPVLESTVYVARSLKLPGTTMGYPLYASTAEVVAPTASCPTPTAVTGTVAIAAPPALDGLALDHDGVAAAIDRSQPHAITWDLAADGAVDTWTVRLFQATASGNQTQLALQRTYVTTARAVAIDPAELAPGGTYVVELDAYQAYPNAASGDFRTFGFPATPYASSTTWSGSFVVTE